MQFEHFLHDEKVDLPSVEDAGHVDELFSNDCMLLKKSDSEGDVNKLVPLEPPLWWILSFSVIVSH